MTVRIKRNCSTSVRDRGDALTFGDITITIDGDHYIKFRELMNVTNVPAMAVLEALLEEVILE